MNIKRVFGFIVILLIFLFIYQVIVVYFENGHEVNYKIATGEIEFNIDEKYVKNADDDGYLISIISNDNKKYIYHLNNNYNKQKRVLKNIQIYQKDDYLCINPITIKDENTEILCSDGQEIYSYNYINNKIDISDFLNQQNEKSLYNNNRNGSVNDSSVKFYKNNFYDNEYLELYRYKYLTVFNKGTIKNNSFSNNDIYKNELGVYIDKYFLIPVYDNSFINQYYLLNVKNGEESQIKFDETISKNIYNIGVVNDRLYVFDLNNKVEYEINPKDKNYKKIGSVNTGFKFYENGKWVDKSITEFTKNKIRINTTVKDDDLKFSYDKIYSSNNAYYLIKGKNVYKDKKDWRILLFEMNNFNNFQVINDRIYYLKDDNLYRYDKYGIKLLVKNNEFKYNNTNIYHVYND